MAVGIALGGCAEEPDPNVLDVGAADFPPHSTAARLAAESTIRIGISGAEVGEDGGPTGFEVELGAIVAGALGIERHEISWIQVEPGHEERLVEDRHVDVLLAGLTVTDDRREIVGMAGPYYRGGLAVLTASGPELGGDPADLDGHGLCVADDPGIDQAVHVVDGMDAVAGLTGRLVDLVAVAARAPLPACVELLRAGEVEAVLGPDLPVAEHAVDDDVVVVFDETQLEYGAGLARDDDGFRTVVSDALASAAADGRWLAAWESTTGQVLGPASPPAVDRP